MAHIGAVLDVQRPVETIGLADSVDDILRRIVAGQQDGGVARDHVKEREQEGQEQEAREDDEAHPSDDHSQHGVTSW
ncbi:hypothetical protein EV560_10599 [Bosea sp. BK604]|nr:hypothetical protein EV560_10599 [Bosea sp. BK604]